MSLREKSPALLVVDIQKGFDDIAYWGGARNNPDAEEKAAQILKAWRTANLPVFIIQHSSTEPQSLLNPAHPGFELQDAFKPEANKSLIVKNVNSAFIGTNLQAQLDAQGIDTVVIVGLTTNHCVSTTTRMAGNLGYHTYLIADATATFDRVGINGEKYKAETLHLTTLANLRDEFATVMNTAQLLEAL
ncbi:cysteine hydrolase family protein [Microscilla marina]|uniref:Isochorismatase n=1 Tax=Microscilla marina ATCC 23134 TaxID=313606 RepID=A1ZWY6_MICM2|nr:cysteine hydrolase family protein [Microscilla marina]EAY25066.1 isochorismatase [Microscilla marina ATCC 23134]